MHRPLGPARGVTLIELVIAVAILALGTAAAWRSLDAARRGVGAQAGRALAQEVAFNRAADLRLADRPAPLSGTERLGGIDWTLTQTTLGAEGGLVQTTISVTATGRPGARLLVWLPAPQDAP
jgi:general secretion pathway protein I